MGGKMTHAEYVRRIEGLLCELGMPYVVMDEAKKAIFADASIKSFDLLVYMEHGPNMLAVVLPRSRGVPTAEQREALREWETVFGRDFVGVFVHATAEPVAWRRGACCNEVVPLRSLLADGWGACPAEQRRAVSA